VNRGEKNEIRVGKKRGIMGKYFHRALTGKGITMIIL
jgi:hypothetical protein